MIPRFFVIITKFFDLRNLEVYALNYVLGYSILEVAMYVGVETWLKTTGGIYVRKHDYTYMYTPVSG